MSDSDNLIATFSDLVLLTPELDGDPIGMTAFSYKPVCKVDGTKYDHAWLAFQGLFQVPMSSAVSVTGARFQGDWCYITPPLAVNIGSGYGFTFYVVQQSYRVGTEQETRGWHKVTLVFKANGDLDGDLSSVTAWSDGSTTALVPTLPSNIQFELEIGNLTVAMYGAVAGVINWVLQKLFNEDLNALAISLSGISTIFAIRAAEANWLLRAGASPSQWVSPMQDFAAFIDSWEHGGGWTGENGYAHDYNQDGTSIRFWRPVGFVGPAGWMLLVKVDHKWATSDGHVTFAIGARYGYRPDWCNVGYDLNHLDDATGAVQATATDECDAYAQVVDQLKVVASGNKDESDFIAGLCDNRLKALVDDVVRKWQKEPVA